jgi:hypothetical protein
MVFRAFRADPREGTGEATMEQLQKDQAFLQAAQATLEAETQEMVEVSDRLHDNIVKAMRLMWRQLVFIWAVVIILFISYFFILGKPSPAVKLADLKPSTVQISDQNVGNAPALQVPPMQESQHKPVIPEWGAVVGIIEQVSTAQLTKDINLFLNAYSPTFSEIDKKKASMLKIWQQFEYLDMKFHVNNIVKPNDHIIIAKVTWDITFEDVHLKKKSNLLRDYTILFSDTSGKWLIQELFQGDKTSDVAAKPT